MMSETMQATTASSGRRVAPPALLRARAALCAEWIKLRSLRSMLVTPVLAAVVCIGYADFLCWRFTQRWHTFDAANKAGFNPLDTNFNVLVIGVLFFGVLGALVVTNEYGNGLIRATLAATPQRDQDDQGRLGGEDEAALRCRREGRADQAVAVLVRHHERTEHSEEQDANHQDVEVGVERIERGLIRSTECVPPLREAPAEKVRVADADDRGERRCHQHGAQGAQLDPFRGERGPRPREDGRARAEPGTRGRGLPGSRHHASLLRRCRNAAAAAAAT